VATELTREKEISIVEIIETTSQTVRFLFSKWLIVLCVGIVFGVVGVLYAWLQKPVYKAEITFAPETGKSSSLGAYAGIAAQFGFDVGGGGTVFEGENLAEFLRSKMLIEKALFSKVSINGIPQVLIDYYAKRNNMYDDWKNRPDLVAIDFSKEQQVMRVRDSVLGSIVEDIRHTLSIERIDKKVNIIAASITSEDESFAKAFIEQLASNGIQYYIEYRSKKSRENVAILQRQFDSVRRVLSGSITSVATSTDLNVNPTRQIVRAGVQNKQIDIQANGQLYGELLKQLELSKIALQKEIPFIEIIDRPRYPLEMKKPGRLRTGFFFALTGGLLCCVVLVGRRTYKRLIQTNPAH